MCRDFRALTVSRADDGWTVRDDDRVVTAPVLVMACGALIPALLNQICGQEFAHYEIEIQKCIVAVVHKRICERIIATRAKDSNYLNLVPFANGTTINMGKLDEPNANLSDTFVDLLGYSARLGETIAYCLPRALDTLPWRTHFYVCQKIGNVRYSSHPVLDYGLRHYFWIEPVGYSNCFAFYPGKFTLAPAAAKALVKFLDESGRISKRVTVGGLQAVNPISISRDSYYREPTHLLYSPKAETLLLREL